MMPPIYVDAAIHAWRGKKWCHLFSEDLAALHVFADRLGLRRSWFQCPPKASWPHYDITAAKRREAIRLGAQPTHHVETLLISSRIMGTLTPEREEKLLQMWMREMLR